MRELVALLTRWRERRQMRSALRMVRFYTREGMA